jgi:hypothetical protein
MSASPAAAAQSNPAASQIAALIAAERARCAPGALVGVRRGCFVDFFDDDARTVSAALKVTLAGGRHARAFCGLPADPIFPRYRSRLEAQGFNVAVIDLSPPSDDDDGVLVDPASLSPVMQAQLAATVQRFALIEDVEAVSRRILAPVLGDLVERLGVSCDQESTARALSLLAAQVATADPLDQDLRADLHNEAWS